MNSSVLDETTDLIKEKSGATIMEFKCKISLLRPSSPPIILRDTFAFDNGVLFEDDLKQGNYAFLPKKKQQSFL